MKQKLIMLLTIAILEITMLTGCANNNKAESTKEDIPKELVQISNPWHSFENLEEAIKTSGISLKIPDSPILSSYTHKSYSILDKEVIEANFYSESDGSNKYFFILRKGATEDDISGDYTTYPNIITKEINGVTVTFKGEEDKNNMASWIKNGCFYYVMFQENVDFKDFETFITDLISLNEE